MEINPQMLRGNWAEGWALDLHTVRSKPLDDGIFETTRTEIGEALYQLKYRGDKTQVEPIARTAAKFLERQPFLSDLAAIIPVPPSDEDRAFQPVSELGLVIADGLRLALASDYLLKVRQTKALKETKGRRSRKVELAGAFKVKDNRFAGRSILLFDDLFRSGETLHEIASVLLTQGKVSGIFVLTVTRTRTKK
jgi:predicted amidophosphoribosyltransferase